MKCEWIEAACVRRADAARLALACCLALSGSTIGIQASCAAAAAQPDPETEIGVVRLGEETPPAISGPCPTARGQGTVSPSITIREMTWLVNGREQKVVGDTMLQARSGDELVLVDVVLCTAGEGGGRVCVDVSPLDRQGRAIFAEHRGTHLLPVVPGEITISGLAYGWTVGDDWAGLTAVVNHWASEKTRDLECAGGLCERDDRVLIEFR